MSGKIKYKLLERGAFEGKLPLSLIYIDAQDVMAAGLTYKEAVQAVARDYGGPAAVDVVDQTAVTVTSDGIVAPSAVVAFAAIDYGECPEPYGFMNVTERPYTREQIFEEPHMVQWEKLYPGRRLYRGPNDEDRGIGKHRTPFNETQVIGGQIANNNTGSEMFNLVTMEEVLTPFFGIMSIMQDREVLVGMSGAEVSVGIGMIVKERGGRIFGFNYGAGQTAHRSGVYAKTVKSDCMSVFATKSFQVENVMNALECGMVPGRHISSSPVNLTVAHQTGHEIDLENISKEAWVELESVGITKEMLAKPVAKPYTREEAIAKADEFVPGVPTGKKYQIKDWAQIRYAEF